MLGVREGKKSLRRRGHEIEILPRRGTVGKRMLHWNPDSAGGERRGL